MKERSITDQLHAKFIAVPQRHSKLDLASFLLIGFAHVVAGVLIFGERSEFISDSDALRQLSIGLWWAPSAAGVCWMALPMLITAGGVPLPRLFTLMLQIAGLCSGFAVLALAFTAAGA